MSAKALVAVAGLFGAAGVATAAVAAHRVGDPNLGIVSNFLMLHAAALLGAAAASSALGLGRLIIVPAWGLVLGAVLFCGDLAIRVFHGASLLPMAAPVGGSILILSWAALGIGGLIGALRRA